jgi:hypothetical protein
MMHCDTFDWIVEKMDSAEDFLFVSTCRPTSNCSSERMDWALTENSRVRCYEILSSVVVSDSFKL